MLSASHGAKDTGQPMGAHGIAATANWGHPRADRPFTRRTSASDLLNEFEMMWALRERFPLHYIVFKQTACHLAHEANVEQVFSRAGNLSDPNID